MPQWGFDVKAIVASCFLVYFGVSTIALQAGQQFCAKSWAQAQQDRPGELMLENYCFRWVMAESCTCTLPTASGTGLERDTLPARLTWCVLFHSRAAGPRILQSLYGRACC